MDKTNLSPLRSIIHPLIGASVIAIKPAIVGAPIIKVLLQPSSLAIGVIKTDKVSADAAHAAIVAIPDDKSIIHP